MLLAEKTGRRIHRMPSCSSVSSGCSAWLARAQHHAQALAAAAQLQRHLAARRAFQHLRRHDDAAGADRYAIDAAQLVALAQPGAGGLALRLQRGDHQPVLRPGRDPQAEARLADPALPRLPGLLGGDVAAIGVEMVEHLLEPRLHHPLHPGAAQGGGGGPGLGIEGGEAVGQRIGRVARRGRAARALGGRQRRVGQRRLAQRGAVLAQPQLAVLHIGGEAGVERAKAAQRPQRQLAWCRHFQMALEDGGKGLAQHQTDLRPGEAGLLLRGGGKRPGREEQHAQQQHGQQQS
nr:hypothetical protein [Pseudoroseomonas cervicalis]